MAARKASIKKSTIKRAERDGRALRKRMGTTQDSFQNFYLQLGMGTANALSGSTYGFNPITRIRTLLEWIYRGSWFGGMAVDIPSEDMTRAGIEITAQIDPQEVEKLQKSFVALKIWKRWQELIKWGRLYGGAIMVLLIDGQRPETPLRLDSIGKGQFKGVMVLDRWMVDPSLQDLVSDFGPHLGEPKFYRVVSDAPAMRGQNIHFTRCIRMLPVELPHWQAVMENLWGLSVFERLYDRMVAFDSATQGSAQLVYKSYLRVFKMNGLRDAQGAGGDVIKGIEKFVTMMARFQGLEGISLIDSEDDFQANSSTSFTGISDALLQFAQQLCGGLKIPLVRFYGQAPAGLNSTGESDLRTYYDGINQDQETHMREGMTTILHVSARNEGIKLPPEATFNFNPLWQMTEDEKSQVSDRDTKLVIETEAAALISPRTALKELRTQSRKTGRWTNITDEQVEAASDDIVAPVMPGEEGDDEDIGNEAGGGGGGGEEDNQQRGEIQGLERAKKVLHAVPKGDRALDADLPYCEIGGIPVVIEYPRGTIRRSNDHTTRMPADCGYVRRVGSAEGDEEWLDCIVGPNHSSRAVWIVDSFVPGGKFDEHKLVLGFDRERDAMAAFRKIYPPTFRKIGAATELSMDQLEFKNWLAKGNKSLPYAT